MTQPLDLDPIRQREQAATPGPWEAFDTDQHWSLHMHGFPMQILKAPKQGTPYAEYWPNASDAEFIVHARQDVPALLARVAELKAELASARAAAFTEAARLLEDTGRDDDAVNLLDNVAKGIRSHSRA